MSRIAFLLPAALVVAAVAGCRAETSEDPPILLERNMYDSERYNPESYSTFFQDHRTMRSPVEGTVPHVAHTDAKREEIMDGPEVATGLLADESNYVQTIPQGVVSSLGGMDKLLARGQERFGIYCTPCHGRTGDGKGMVVCKRDKVTDPCESRGFPPLPAYTDPRIRQMPDGQLFATITHGVRTMPSYAAQVPVADRWAIVGYVRALELSQIAANPSSPEPKK